MTRALKHVTVVEGGRLFGVNSADMIYYNNNYKSNWIQLPGALKQLDSDGTMICGANSANDFYCRKDLFSVWVLQ